MAVVGGFAMSLIATLSGIYLISDVGLGPFQLVLVGSVLEGSVLLFEVPTGVVADAISRRTSVLIGYVLLGAGFLLYAVPSFLVVLVAQVVWGVGATFISGANIAWVVDEIGEDAARPLFLRATQYGQMAAFAGIAVSIGLGSIALGLPVAAGGVVFLLLALWLARTMRETHRPTGEADLRRAIGATFASVRDATRLRPVLFVVLAVAALHGASTEGFDRLWELQLLQGVDLPTVGGLGVTPWFGLLRAVGLVLAIGATAFVRHRLRDRSGDAGVRALAVTAALFAVAMASYAVASTLTAAVLAYWFVVAVRGVHTPLFTSWVNTGLQASSRATVNSLGSQADALGQVGGGPVLGWIASIRSVRAALGAAAVLALPVVPLVRWGRRSERGT
ncbi:MAG TPA: MFS transporter [Acidimicrobiales bacterium]|nr:MFS transporter [Acidimicrobiales bacterium]